MQNQSYRNTWAVSQSMLKKWTFMSPKQWKKRYIDNFNDDDKDEDYFTFGSLVDILLFTPEELDKRFYIGKEKIPSEAIAWIIKEYYKELSLINKKTQELNEVLPFLENLIMVELDSSPNLLIQCANNYVDSDGKYGWQKNWKDETRIKSILEKGKEYFDSIKEADGRKVISPEQNFLALEIKNILQQDNNTKDYFIPTSENELIFQLEIFTEYCEELPVKGALDILRINHKDKTIQIADFKTSQSAYNFIDSIKKYGYCTQLSFYETLVYDWVIKERPEIKDYSLLNSINIVIDVYDLVPYIYEYNVDDILDSKHGNKKYLLHKFGINHPFKIKKGWMDILDEIKWHYKNNYWEKSKKMYEEGKIKLNLLNN